MPSNRIAGIDVLRGTFALGVLGAHAYQISTSLAPVAPFYRTLLDATLSKGNYWVTGFFVLSGYCIELSCTKIDRSTGGSRTREYIAARITRLLPIYYLGLVVALAIESIFLTGVTRPKVWVTGVSAQGFFSQLTFLMVLNGQTFGSYQASNTIGAELVYYLLWAMGRFRKGINPRKYLWRSAVAVFVVLTLPLYVACKLEHNDETLKGLFSVTFNYNSWLVGASLAVDYARVARCCGRFSRFWWVGLPIMVILEGPLNLPITLRPLVLAPCFTLLILRSTNWAIESKIGQRAAAWLGHLSYPLYLFHGPLVMLACGALATTWSFGALTYFSVGCLVALAFAGTLGVVAEVKFLSLRAGLLKRLRASAGGLSAQAALGP